MNILIDKVKKKTNCNNVTKLCNELHHSFASKTCNCFLCENA